MILTKSEHIRLDLELIADLIERNSTVLDLGCGNGELLQKLIREKDVQGHGVEFSDKQIYGCVNKGVPVIHADLNEGLDDYPDKSFNYVILSRTLQVVKRPDIILKEMLRVGEKCIVSFPNFGFWKVRFQLLKNGKMPITKSLPYDWYDTPNIHLSTIKDFKHFCQKENFKINNQIYIDKDSNKKLFANLFPNYFAELAILSVQNGG
jgi:methionine biosynthesis protein MetW